VDPRLHFVQGKAKGVRPTQLAALLEECYRERFAMYERHKAVATHVLDYNANNAYQYAINREETHLTWLEDALRGLGAAIPEPPPGPSITIDRGTDAWLALARQDGIDARAFVEKWRARIETLTNARDRTMLRLMLGEVQEQARFFEQAAAGDDDLLGHSDVGAGKRGSVAAARWQGD
jgi:hypothetical protein